jgi:hypothetical protein
MRRCILLQTKKAAIGCLCDLRISGQLSGRGGFPATAVLLDLPRLNAGGADAQLFGDAIHDRSDRLEIRIPAP